MIIDTGDAEYLAHVRRAIDNGTLIALPERCPECRQHVGGDYLEDTAHVLTRTSGDRVAVLIGCEGYWTVAPDRVGMRRGNWQPTISSELDSAVESAGAAFWATFAAAFPDVKTGDVAPDASIALETAMRTAARQWLEANKPATRTELVAVVRAEMSVWEPEYAAATYALAAAIVDGRIDAAWLDEGNDRRPVAEAAGLDPGDFDALGVAVDSICKLAEHDVDTNESGNTATWLIYEETLTYAGTTLGAFMAALREHVSDVSDAAELIVEARP